MQLLIATASLLFSTSGIPPCNDIPGWDLVTIDSQVQ